MRHRSRVLIEISRREISLKTGRAGGIREVAKRSSKVMQLDMKGLKPVLSFTWFLSCRTKVSVEVFPSQCF